MSEISLPQSPSVTAPSSEGACSTLQSFACANAGSPVMGAKNSPIYNNDSIILSKKEDGFALIKVAAAIFEEKGKILLCQRGEGGNCAFLWEFPGGKIEDGESPKEALVREIREELGIESEAGEVFSEYKFSYPERDIYFYFIKAKITSGEIKLNVHKDFRWVLPQEAAKLSAAPADIPIIEKLLEKR